MMKGFQDITLSWAGESYTVPADQQLRLIAEIEDALMDRDGTPAVAVLSRRGGPTQARLSAAFGAALRYAGAHVTDDEVYLTLQEDIANMNTDVQSKIQAATLGLLAIVSPPVMSRIHAMTESEAPGKPQAATTE